MIQFQNYDSSEDLEELPCEVPELIESIDVYHDGGRLSICINGEEVFKRVLGTRDCRVRISRESSQSASENKG